VLPARSICCIGLQLDKPQRGVDFQAIEESGQIRRKDEGALQYRYQRDLFVDQRRHLQRQ